MTFTKPTSYFLMGATGLLILGSQGALAGTMTDTQSKTSLYQSLATVTIGPDFVQTGRAQTLTLLSPFQNHYTATHRSQTAIDFGAFVGVERTFLQGLSAQLGASVYIDSQLTAKGHVWQFGVPKFDNFTYGYHIKPMRAMLTSKLLTTFPNHHSLHPYLSGEIGAAFNRASNYHETPIAPLVTPMSPFGNHTETSFAWGVGLGMDCNVTQQVRVGLGYQFSNLGAASLGRTTAATTNQALSLSHIYANQLRFQLTYLA